MIDTCCASDGGLQPDSRSSGFDIIWSPRPISTLDPKLFDIVGTVEGDGIHGGLLGASSWPGQASSEGAVMRTRKFIYFILLLLA